MTAADFLNKYFITPIYTDSGYNIYNTIVYAVLALVALLGIYKLLRKLDVKIDYKLFWAALPFVIFGSATRTFVDAKLYGIGFWTVSPGIYLATAGFFLVTIGTSVAVRKFTGLAHWKSTGLVGLGAVLLNFGLVADKLQLVNVRYGLAIVGLAALISACLFCVFKFAKFSACTKHFWPFPAHMLDAAATFIAVDFLGATEKHPLPAFATAAVGSAAVMFVLKLLVLIPLVYFLDKEFKDAQFVTFLLIAVTVLGFATGIRDLLTILLV